jgi:hypothetical protein
VEGIDPPIGARLARRLRDQASMFQVARTPGAPRGKGSRHSRDRERSACPRGPAREHRSRRPGGAPAPRRPGDGRRARRRPQ